MVKSFKHSLSVLQQSAGGLSQYLGDEYSKAIALCYDPHTTYLPLEKENFDSDLGQQSMAFGFHFKEEDNGAVLIESLAPGSPAFKSGQLNKGDKILSVQWENQKPIEVADGGLEELVEVLKMSNHDKATLKVKKPDGTERSVSLWKDMLEDDDEDKVKSFILKGDKIIGFLSLPAFYEDWEEESDGVKGCANDVAREIVKLKKENIQGLILDLRYNGGGSVQEAIQLAGLFIDIGPVAQYKSREAKAITLKDVNRGTIYDGPLMLLVNGHSASASEMVAGTLQDYNRAVIAGTPTYGKATAQAVLPMDTTIKLDADISNIKTNSYLKLTMSQLFRVNGTTAQAKGVQPDILFPDVLQAEGEKEADNDHVLISAAIEASKYFKPLIPISLSPLQSVAKNEINASLYFTEMNKYIASYIADQKLKDINLKLSDILAARKSKPEILNDSTILEKEKSPYTIYNNAYEQEGLKASETLREINQQWIKFLNRDPYLHVAYKVLATMIK